MYHILQFQSSVSHFYIVLLLLAPTTLVPLQRLHLWRVSAGAFSVLSLSSHAFSVFSVLYSANVFAAAAAAVTS